MSAIKNGLVLIAVALAAVFTGCIFDTNTDSLTFGTLTISPDTITTQTTATVKVDVEASEEITANDFQVTITDANGTPTSKLTATIAYETGKSGELTITITPASDCPSGTYTIKIEGTVGTATSSKITYVTVKSSIVTTPVDVATYTLGAQGSSTGSNVDLDAGKVYVASEVDATAKTKIDLFYYVKDGAPTLYSPSVAQGVTTGTNATPIVKLSGIDFTSITTKEAIADLWEQYGANATAQKIAVSEGDVILLKSDLGAYFLVYVNSIVAGTSGTITIKSAN